MPKNLTEQAVSKLKARTDKRQEIPDGVVPGLRLRISTSGKKYWYLFYKVAGANPDGSRGKNSRMSLGSYPLVSLKDAQRAAEGALDIAARGKDPKAAKQAGIDERVFSRIDNLLPLFIEHHAKPNTKLWKETNSLLSNSMLPYWGERLIGEISRADVNQLLDTIKMNETAAKAREVRRHVSVFMNWCVDRGYAPANPMAGLRRKDLASRPRERVLEVEELRQIWNVAKALGYPHGTIVRFLILSGQRRSEIGGLRWSWARADRVEVPAENYKTKRPHVYPLTKQMQGMLAECPRCNQGDYVFTTTMGQKPVSSWSKAKAKFDTKLDLEPWTYHDIRRSVATHMARSGVLQEHIERVLGHVVPGIAGTYNRHSYFEKKMAATRKWQAEFNISSI